MPFQNVSLKGIFVKFCPIFSALSVNGEVEVRELNTKTTKNMFESVARDTSEEFPQVRFAFVQGSLPIFVADAHLSPVSHEVLRGKKDRSRCERHFKSLS